MNATGARILIVDDQQEILELAALALRDAGYLVSTATDGRQALESLGSERTDLVLLDINMPRMDGWETLRLIRADDTLAGLPILMFSIKGEISDKVHSLQEGATGYVNKPFELDDLLDRVARALAAAPERPVTSRGRV